MVFKVYKRIGIRRNNNLSDISSPVESLDNILDSLAPIGGETFVSSDLDAIRNLFSQGLDNDEYKGIVNSAVEFTTPNGSNTEFDPRITYQNRLDKFTAFAGEPRFNGGNGLTANYYQNDQINFDTDSDFNYGVGISDFENTTSGQIFTGITTEGAIISDNFWEQGNFEYTGKIHPQSVKSNVGVKWEGFYIPSVTGNLNLNVSSTGYFTADFEKDGYVGGGSTYTEYARVGITTTVNGTKSGTEIVVVPTNTVKHVGIGMSVSGTGIRVGSKVSGSNRLNGEITLENPDGNPIESTGSTSVTFSRDIGSNVRSSIQTHVLTAYQRYRVRFRYFHPKSVNTARISRSVDINYRESNMSEDGQLRFNKLYSLDYDFSDSVKGEFNDYYDQSVLFGGSNVEGIGSRTLSNNYVKLKSSKKVDITYKVKSTLAQITKAGGAKTVTLTNGSAIVGGFDSSSNTTSGIEVGNYVFGTNIPDGARVIDVFINQFIVLDQVATGTSSSSLTFIDHRGFVKRVRVNSNGGSTTINAASGFSFRANSPNATTTHTDIQKGMIAISSNISSYKKVTNVEPTQITLSASVSTGANEDVFFYQSRGLKDNTLQIFCDRLDGSPSVKCLVANTSGTTLAIDTKQITVDDTSIIQNNWNIQGFNFWPNTTIQSIDPSNKIITIQDDQGRGLRRAMTDNSQFTATSNNDDRQLCCPPTDTSPPFNATEEGLETVLNERPNLKFNAGNIVFDQLSATFPTGTSKITTASPTSPVNRKIDIQTPLSTLPFKILGYVEPNP
tara:strand:+ start:4080 stop:6428 length:2349 start_codon:yes stop_codon:yes gene_type:complete